jgi:hypothetical protein
MTDSCVNLQNWWAVCHSEQWIDMRLCAFDVAVSWVIK